MAHEGEIPSVKDLASSGKHRTFLFHFCVFLSFLLEDQCVGEQQYSFNPESGYVWRQVHCLFEHLHPTRVTFILLAPSNSSFHFPLAPSLPHRDPSQLST